MISTERELDKIQIKHTDTNKGHTSGAPIQQYLESRCLACNTSDAMCPDRTPRESTTTHYQRVLPRVCLTLNSPPSKGFLGFRKCRFELNIQPYIDI